MISISCLTFWVQIRMYPDRFTEDRWVESTYGIHFWMSREEAIAY